MAHLDLVHPRVLGMICAPMTDPHVNRFSIIRRALGLPLLPQERLVLIALAQHIRTSGARARQTWVHQQDIADELGMPIRNVKRHMDKLEQSGAIQRWRMRYGYLYRIPPTWDEVDASVSPRTVR